MKKDRLPWHHVYGISEERLEELRAGETDPEVLRKYGDILDLKRPESGAHPPMSSEARAAQFAPFAALTGFGAAVEETGRYTEEKPLLEEDRLEELDRKFARLEEWLRTGSRKAERPVRVDYFVPDGRKTGGTIRACTGRVLRIDRKRKTVLLDGAEEIPFSAVLDLDADET